MRISLRMATLAIVVATILVLPAQRPLYAAAVVCGVGDAVWDGGSNNGIWHSPLNWVGDTLPTTNADVCIPDQTPDVTIEYNFDPLTINSLKSDEAIAVQGGILAINSASQINGALEVSGHLTGSGDLTVTGPLTWSGSGIMSGTGTTTALAGIIIERATFKELGRTLVNLSAQTATWEDGVITINSGGIFDNQGTFNAVHPVDRDISGPGTFNNSGTFSKSVGTGITRITAAFNNTSPLNVTTGTVILGGGGSGTGAYNVSAGATLEFSAGTHTLDASSSVLGAGTVIFSGGTVNFDGTYPTMSPEPPSSPVGPSSSIPPLLRPAWAQVLWPSPQAV